MDDEEKENMVELQKLEELEKQDRETEMTIYFNNIFILLNL